MDDLLTSYFTKEREARLAQAPTVAPQVMERVETLRRQARRYVWMGCLAGVVFLALVGGAVYVWLWDAFVLMINRIGHVFLSGWHLLSDGLARVIAAVAQFLSPILEAVTNPVMEVVKHIETTQVVPAWFLYVGYVMLLGVGIGLLCVTDYLMRKRLA